MTMDMPGFYKSFFVLFELKINIFYLMFDVLHDFDDYDCFEI